MSPSNCRTVGFVIPDRFHLVYLDLPARQRAGFAFSTGSRISMGARAGHA